MAMAMRRRRHEGDDRSRREWAADQPFAGDEPQAAVTATRTTTVMTASRAVDPRPVVVNHVPG